MTNLKQAAQQALEALEWADNAMYEGTPIQVNTQKAIAALKAALAEPVQEPYAWMAVGGSIWRHKTSEDDVPLYTVPPKRKPLTDDQITEIGTTTELVRAVERAHVIGGDA